MRKNIRPLIALSILFVFVLAFLLIQPASAAPQTQVYYFTPTPQPDGRVLYTVKEGDSCISIALLNNISEEQLRSLNNLTGDACLFLMPGQQLLLDIVEQQPTAGPSLTPTSILPSPTPFNGSGDICVLLFNDINGNALLDDDSRELPLLGGAVSINDRDGKVALTGITNAEEAICFEELPEGTYNITIAVPELYNPTMRTNATVELTAGNTIVVDFGAQISSNVETIPGEVVSNKKSPFLGILGVLVLLVGIGAAVYAVRTRKF
jgi:hypothetical protein